MRILVNSENIVICASSSIEFGIFQGEEKWKISDTLYALDYSFKLFDNVTLPSDYIDGKYCYELGKEFYPNPNWIEPAKPVEEQLNELKLSKAISELEIDERLTKLELGLV